MNNALWALLGIGGAYLAYRYFGSSTWSGESPISLTGTPNPAYQTVAPVTFDPKTDVRDHRKGEAPSTAVTGNSSYYNQPTALQSSFTSYNGQYANGVSALVQ